MVEAIILAGTPIKKEHRMTKNGKFFNKIYGRYSGKFVLDALENAYSVERINIIGPRKILEERVISLKKPFKIIQQVGSLYDNAFEAFKNSENYNELEKQLLYVSCDSPFLTSEAIDDFIETAPNADFIQPYYLKEEVEELFPGFYWPYTICKEGEIKMGNMALVKPNKIKNKRRVNIGLNMRKIATLNFVEEIENFGNVFLEALNLKGGEGFEIVTKAAFLRYVARPFNLPAKIKENIAKDLSLDRISGIFSELIGGKVKYVRSKYPEGFFDIDSKKESKYASENYGMILARIHSR